MHCNQPPNTSPSFTPVRPIGNTLGRAGFAEQCVPGKSGDHSFMVCTTSQHLVRRTRQLGVDAVVNTIGPADATLATARVDLAHSPRAALDGRWGGLELVDQSVANSGVGSVAAVALLIGAAADTLHHLYGWNVAGRGSSWLAVSITMPKLDMG